MRFRIFCGLLVAVITVLTLEAVAFFGPVRLMFSCLEGAHLIALASCPFAASWLVVDVFDWLETRKRQS